jgi:hypothetical protein
MTRLVKSFAVFDCDAHINDPLRIWDYIPDSKKELAPIVHENAVGRR